MNAPSLIFWLIFVLPLVGVLIWLIRQDKRNGKIGLVVLAVIVIGAIVYTIVKNDGKQDPATNQLQQEQGK